MLESESYEEKKQGKNGDLDFLRRKTSEEGRESHL
jgi:hypothetical protein